MEKCNLNCETCPFLEPPYCLWFLKNRPTLLKDVFQTPNWYPADYTDLFGEDLDYFPKKAFSFVGTIFELRVKKLNKAIKPPMSEC